MCHNLKNKKCYNKCCNIYCVENFEMINYKWNEEDNEKIPDKAGAIICLKKNKDNMKFLLVQSYGMLWGFPKGSRNDNETLAECAKRELFEETGIDIPLKHFVIHIDLRINEQLARYYYLELSNENLYSNISIRKNINHVPNDATGYTWIRPKCLNCLRSNNKKGIYALNFHCKLILEKIKKIKIDIYDKGRVINIDIPIELQFVI